MEVLELLRAHIANADRMLRQVFEPVTAEQAAWRLPGSTANTIGATFMHCYYSEDQMVHGLSATSTIFDDGGWKSRLGYDHEDVWTYTGAHDLALLREYADAVTAATTSYVGALDQPAIEQEIDTPRGRQPRVQRLSVYLINHKFQHAGEIAALLGCQGVKGLPF